MNENPSEQEQSGATAASEAQTQHSSFDQFIQEIGELAVVVGMAVGKTAEDLTGLMVIPADQDLRRNLDVLVESGVSKTRAQAALKLLGDGLVSNQPLYEKVEKTRAQIQLLRSQLKSLVNQ